MAFNDALFQLGMDLTRSSPAQKEEHDVVAHVAQHGKSIERASGRFAGHTQSMGTHLTIDVYGSTSLGTSSLGDVGHVETTLARCVEAASATLQQIHLHSVPATGGVSGLAVLSDGHITFHSRPQAGYAALDIATMDSLESDRWVAAAKSAFGDCRVVPRVHSKVADEVDTAPAILMAVLPPQRRRSALKSVRVKAA